MSRWTPRTLDHIGAQILSWVKARTQLTDVRPSGLLAQLGYAFARIVAQSDIAITFIELMFDLSKNTGEDLDARGAEVLPSGKQRGPATKSEGFLRFSRDVASPTPVDLPAGSRAARTAEGRKVVYHTIEAGQILANETESASIAAVCAEAGDVGNCEAGAIGALLAPTVGVNSVTNLVRFRAGLDEMGDPQYREAILRHVAALGRCHEAGVMAALLSAVAAERVVRYATLVDFPLSFERVRAIIDDGFGSAGWTDQYTDQGAGVLLAHAYGGEQTLQLPSWPTRNAPFITVTPAPAIEPVVYGAWGQVYFPEPLAEGSQVQHSAYFYWTGLVADAQKRVDGDPDDLDGYPRHTPVGTYIVVEPATVVWREISGVIVLVEGASADAGLAAARSAIVEYVNGLGIGRPQLLAGLYKAAMSVEDVMNFIPADDLEDEYVAPDVVQRTKPDLVDLNLQG